MGCIINWSADAKEEIAHLNVAADGCIVQWVPKGGASSLNKAAGGCIIEWAAIPQQTAAAAQGCIVDWAGKSATEVQSLSSSKATESGCIIQWSLDPAELSKVKVAQDGCIINW
jgi:hypothetical protein